MISEVDNKLKNHNSSIEKFLATLTMTGIWFNDIGIGD